MHSLRPLRAAVWTLSCLCIFLVPAHVTMAASKTTSADLEKLHKQSLIKGKEYVAKCDADLAKLADILDRAKKGNSAKVGEIEKAIEKVSVARSFYTGVLIEADVKEDITDLEAKIHAGRRQGQEPSDELLAKLNAKRADLQKAISTIQQASERHKTIAGDTLQTPMMQLYLATEKDGKEGKSGH